MTIQISDSVVWQEADESVSVYHTENGDFRTLNETAAKIWLLVDKEHEREAVRTKLVHEYAGTNTALQGHILRDVDSFIDSMIEQGFLVEEN